MSSEMENADADFLAFCHLVQDAFIGASDPGVGEDTARGIPAELKARAHAFAARAGDQSRTPPTFAESMSAEDFKGRLLVCTELAKWTYEQLRILHSNIVLERGVTGAGGADREFVILYRDRPHSVPRLAPSLGHRPLAPDSSLSFPDFFPAGAPTDLRVIDQHFALGYLFLLSALEDFPESVSNVREAKHAFRKHWEGESRGTLLKQVLGIEPIASGMNVFGVHPPNLLQSEKTEVRKDDSDRRKLFFDLTLGFDRWLDALRGWFDGTVWDFESSYVRTPEKRTRLENDLDIVFLEEGEILWELLRFYACALAPDNDRAPTLERLLELFWIAKRNGDGWETTERFQNLANWAAREGKPDFSSGADNLADAVAREIQGQRPADLLKKCRSIVPIYAFLMTLPPPAGLYRCEMGFKALRDADSHAAINSVWCFTTINFPEQLGDGKIAAKTLSTLVAKQKLLVNLIVGATLREEFKAAYRKTILHHGKKSAIAAIMARNMSHNIGSHVLAQLDTPETLKASLSDGNNESNTADGPDVGPMATFNAYLRTRMDFIADIATGVANGHVALALGKDILAHFDAQAMLRRHISGIDSLRVDKVVLEIDGCSTGAPDDVMMAVPNGVLGAQAVYVLLENVIRNSAKHTPGVNRDTRLGLRITVRQSKKYPGMLELCVYDQLGAGTLAIVKRLNVEARADVPGLLSLPITNDAGEPNTEAWGLKEIRICAAYLRGLPPHEVDSNRYQPGDRQPGDGKGPPLVEAILNPADDSLGYRLYLLRPKHVLLLDTASQLTLSGETRDRLASVGIEYHSAQFHDVFSTHDFVVRVNVAAVVPASTELARTTGGFHSLRTLDIEAESSTSIPKHVVDQLLLEPTVDRADAFITYLWKRWVGHRFSRPTVPTLVVQTPEHAECWNDATGLSNGRPAKDLQPLPPHAIVYDRHGERLGALKEKTKHAGVLRDAFSYDPYGERSPTRSLLEPAPVRDVVRQRLAYQLIESGASGIIILDERLQFLCAGKSEQCGEGVTVPLPELLNRSRVFIPPMPAKDSVDLDLNLPEMDPLVAWLSQFKRHGSFEGIDFVVVHLGVIEKLFRGLAGAFDEEAAARELSYWEASGTTVVITSGRGNPGVVRGLNARFVHYSQISRHVHEQRSKYHLCRVLYSARRLPK